MLSAFNIISYVYSSLPDSLVKKLVLGKSKLDHFASEQDITKTKKFILLSIILSLVSFVVFIILGLNLLLSAVLSFCLFPFSLFVLCGHVRSQIFTRYKTFDETAYILLNSISIGLLIYKSIFYSIDLLLKKDIVNDQYSTIFKDLLMQANFGGDENQLIRNFAQTFFSEEYIVVLENLSGGRYIESSPNFLLQMKREMGIIEDNIVIFIALSCLLPLALSMVIPLIINANSILLLLFPLFFGLFGSFFLRYIQDRSSMI